MSDALSAFAEFLRDRRERLAPEQVGLPRGRRRRTGGLRREEVAQLADIGTAWYTALEQGRAVRPSDQVLLNLARALCLNAAEQDHLFVLAGRRPPARVMAPPTEVDAPTRTLLERFEPDPAYVVGPRWDVIAWNQPAAELFGFDRPQERYANNSLWRLFVTQPIPEDPTDWERTARALTSAFRMQSAVHAEDPRFRALIADLLAESEHFRRLWPLQDVRDIEGGRKTVEHPTRGRTVYDFMPLRMTTVGCWLMVYLTA